MPVITRVLFILLLVSASLLAGPALAKVFTYNGTPGEGSVQDLINASSNGDSIYLAGGRYSENLRINRSIVFGALDSDNLPEIVASRVSGAGITLVSDGVSINGVILSGDADYGLLVKSSNNQIRDVTVRGMSRGIGLNAAMSNIFSGNTLVDNAVGIEVDRISRSNIFYLNYLNNTRDVDLLSSENTWSSGQQVYKYGGRDYTGQVGNFWSRYNGIDENGDGIGDTAYLIQSDVPGAGILTGARSPSVAGGAVTDRAPIVSPTASYTLLSTAAGPFNATPIDNGGGLRPPDQPGVQQQGIQQLPAGPSPADAGTPGSAPNPFVPLLMQFWYIIPVALVIAAIAGIWAGRRWRQRVSDPAHGQSTSIGRNLTVVRQTLPEAPDPGTGTLHYAAHLPPALEVRYPDAEYVAEGGVSRVFRAWDPREGREVAVKVPIRFDEVTGTQFTKELHVWEGLHHKNIVEIYAANIFPVPYIEMEYVPSPLSGRKFPVDTGTAVRIITGVAEGLRYAHEQGIVHRDIKPANIMIARDGTPKISDWGLSKTEGTRQSGIIGFSLEYAAPEQLAPNLFGQPGPWTDIYQLGVLFYEMLAGHVPFSGGGVGEVTHAILHDDPAPLDLEGITDAALIRSIIGRCMAKKPQERYPSVPQLLEDLKRIRT